MYASPQTDEEAFKKILQDELDQVLRGIDSMARPDRFHEAQKQWPESTNIEDRRNEHVDAILEEMRKKKF